MSERDWLGLVRAGMPPFWKAMALDGGGDTWERDGVVGTLIPAAPKRSVFNSVFYEDGEALLASLEELAAWYRDLIAVGVGAEEAVLHYDRLEELREDGMAERAAGAERAAEAVRQTWRNFEEFNIDPELALEALFVELRRELAGSVVAAA